MSARKELIVFLLVAAAALGSILSFALTSHRREAQTHAGHAGAGGGGGRCLPNRDQGAARQGHTAHDLRRGVLAGASAPGRSATARSTGTAAGTPATSASR